MMPVHRQVQLSFQRSPSERRNTTGCTEKKDEKGIRKGIGEGVYFHIFLTSGASLPFPKYPKVSIQSMQFL